ncbi:ATP-dependent Clp protease proteolytic subunit [Stenotrophomonas sp. SM006]
MINRYFCPLVLSGIILSTCPKQATAEPVSEINISSASSAWNSCQVLKKGVVYVQGSNALCVKGYIDYDLADQFMTRVKNAESIGLSIDLVLIESQGGELRPAIRIAKKIEELHASVAVGGMCASSCAQFVFMAGRQKLLLRQSHLLFHGGPVSEQQIKRMNLSASAVSSLNRQNLEMTEFYQERNLDLRMLTEPPAIVQARIDAGEIVMWSWSKAELESFGVMGLALEE